MKRYLWLVLAVSCIETTLAQSGLYQNSPEKQFNEALELFQKEQYTASKYSFDHLRSSNLSNEHKIELEFYYAISALKIENPDGPGLIREFIITYPDNIQTNEAAFLLGDHFFQKRDYKNALENFQLVNVNRVYPEQRAEILFKSGYSFFLLKDYKNASNYFEQVKRFRNDFLADAYYYTGYIAMEEGNNEAAIKNFQEADKAREYSSKIPYMLSAIYYKEKKYNELIEYAGSSLRDRSGLEKKEEIHLLLAEAHFERKDYRNASINYDAFVSSKKRALSRDQKYKAGVAQYETGNYLEASNYFKDVALVNDKLGQISSYYLGHSYIKLNNLQFAANSFNAASKSDNDKDIKQDALFNFAKVNLERGVFQEAVNALDSYLETYPDGRNVQEAESLLSDALINTSNYLRAITHIEKLNNKTDRIKAAYQKVTFYQGIAYYRDGKYSPAIAFFDKSQIYPLDRPLLIQSHFWKGEAHSSNQNLVEAIKSYEAVIGLRPNNNDPYLIKTHYGLGYAYFNTDQYNKAGNHFRNYTDKLRGSSNKENYDEALIRLGDTYYVQKDFTNALNTFNRAIQERNQYSDYAHFRAGVVLNFQNRNRDGIDQLNRVINQYPNSVYLEDVLFQKAQINMEETNYSEAREGFSTLINSKPNSPFLPFALEGRAVANYSLKNYEETIEDYKRILENHPNSENADAALVGLQESLSLLGRSGEFSRYLSNFKNANPDNRSLQNIEYEAAKNLFFNQAYNESIKAFGDYIKNYPNSGQIFEARYFIGDAFYRLGDKSNALSNFYELEKADGSIQKSRAIQRIAEIEFENGNFKKAIPYFRSSINNARNKVEEYESFKGLMESYYETGRFDSTNFFADKIIELGNITAEAEPSARLFKAKSLLEQDLSQDAEDVLIALINEYKTVHGAEGLFLLANSYNEKGNFIQSNDLIFDFSAPFGIYDYWYGKSFILLARNYMKLNETFQAKATLESIVEQSTNDEIRKEAGELLKNIN